MKSCVSIHTLSWAFLPSLKCVLTRALLRGDAPNLVPIELGEPQVAIRPGRDAQWLAAKFVPTPRGQGERGETAAGGDAPDVSPSGEPEVAIRPGRDADRVAAARGGGELGDSAGFGPGGSATQAQQADTGDQGGKQSGQVRPPTRMVHVSFSFYLVLCQEVLFMGMLASEQQSLQH